VPRKAVLELARLVEQGGEVAFQRVENHLVFVVGDRVLASKMIEGQFPAFEKVILVSGDKAIEIARDSLATAIRRVSLLSSERSRAIKVTLTPGSFEVTANSPELGEARESVSVEYAGPEVSIGFNAQYILDFLGAVGTEIIRLELRDADSQGILTPVGDDANEYRYVVMPMRF
jgi:DNA polymerase-3 subunit beta